MESYLLKILFEIILDLNRRSSLPSSSEYSTYLRNDLQKILFKADQLVIFHKYYTEDLQI